MLLECISYFALAILLVLGLLNKEVRLAASPIYIVLTIIALIWARMSIHTIETPALYFISVVGIYAIPFMGKSILVEDRTEARLIPITIMCVCMIPVLNPAI